MLLLNQLYEAGNLGYFEDYLAMEVSGGENGHRRYQGKCVIRRSLPNAVNIVNRRVQA
jgi:hypothetical protein